MWPKAAYFQQGVPEPLLSNYLWSVPTPLGMCNQPEELGSIVSHTYTVSAPPGSNPGPRPSQPRTLTTEPLSRHPQITCADVEVTLIIIRVRGIKDRFGAFFVYNYHNRVFRKNLVEGYL